MLVGAIDVLALDIDGVLTDGRVALGRGGEETKGIAFRDLDAIAKARRAGVQIALVTGEEGPLVDVIAKRIDADRVLSGKKDKHAALHALAEDLHMPAERICFVGDADRDARAFACVGLGLAPSDASPLARERAHRVLASRGGEGAVAEAVNIVLETRETALFQERREHSLRRIVEDSLAVHQSLAEAGTSVLADVAAVFVGALRGGRKILFCGNGGSAADAQHVAAELVGRFKLERDPWPAIALSTDTSILTAVSNDWEFEDVFARQVRALARPGDVVVGISTSGKSPNIIRALSDAKKKGATTVAFVGSQGGPIADIADVAFKAPSSATPRIQEIHILAWHAVCEVVEETLAARPRLSSVPPPPHG
ncbi:MAG TPA: SIS domain-containing protein [Polyangiaceae bacterium]|nr:SIS domain-containing protein [Polyangiaceae bacterium]